MTDGRDHWYLRPGIWFWVVIALGAALRFYCVIFTEGTQDVEIWERHARDVREHGLIGYYHGNTDCAVAFFLLLALWFISKEKLIPAAIVVGASLWIKLPGVVAIPALIFFIPKWKHRFVFLALVGVVALVTYLPAVIQDAPV